MPLNWWDVVPKQDLELRICSWSSSSDIIRRLIDDGVVLPTVRTSKPKIWMKPKNVAPSSPPKNKPDKHRKCSMVWPKLLVVRLNQLKSRNLKNTILLEYKVFQQTRRDINMSSSPATKFYPSLSKFVVFWILCLWFAVKIHWFFIEILALCKNRTTVIMNCAVDICKNCY